MVAAPGCGRDTERLAKLADEVGPQPIESQPSLSRRELRLVSFRDHDRPMQFVGTYQNTDVFFKIAQQLAK